MRRVSRQKIRLGFCGREEVSHKLLFSLTTAQQVVVVDAKLVALMFDVFHQEELLQPIVCHSQTKVSGVLSQKRAKLLPYLLCIIIYIPYKNVCPKPRKTIVKQLVLQRPPRKPRFTVAYLPYLTAHGTD